MQTSTISATGMAQGSGTESSASAVSWGAIIGGAFIIAAVSVLLLALGSGLSLSSVSPWSNSGVSGTTFTVITAVWLIVVQWVSAAFGGYVTGRMRTKWVAVHTDEIFFRDTAHGFLAWAVATVVTVAFLASAASSVISGTAHTATTAASSAITGASQGAAQSGGSGNGVSGYYLDQLFRSDQPGAAGQDPRPEATRIVANDIANGSFPDEDKTYLSRLVAARTGISQDEATQRVNKMIAAEQDAAQKTRAAADQARKATAYTSFYTFFSMLIGAFIASVAAALGGRSRDEY